MRCEHRDLWRNAVASARFGKSGLSHGPQPARCERAQPALLISNECPVHGGWVGCERADVEKSATKRRCGLFCSGGFFSTSKNEEQSGAAAVPLFAPPFAPGGFIRFGRFRSFCVQCGKLRGPRPRLRRVFAIGLRFQTRGPLQQVAGATHSTPLSLRLSHPTASELRCHVRRHPSPTRSRAPAA